MGVRSIFVLSFHRMKVQVVFVIIMIGRSQTTQSLFRVRVFSKKAKSYHGPILYLFVGITEYTERTEAILFS